MTKTIQRKLINECTSRYGSDLAAVLIFGSFRTGSFVHGESDVDTIILFKDVKKYKTFDMKKVEEEKADLADRFKDETLTPLAIHHFAPLGIYERHIYDKGSWSSWITVVAGSIEAYTTEEFRAFKKKLAGRPLDNEKVAEYLIGKDKSELDGYLSMAKGWALTKGIFSHTRRKLQILHYKLKGDAVFDYETCLDVVSGDERREFAELGILYMKRDNLGSRRDTYFAIARELTQRVLEVLK